MSDVAKDPPWLAAADRVAGVVVQIAAHISALTIVALLLNIVIDVFMRYTFNAPLPATIEIVSYWWMVLLTFLGQGLTQRRGEQLEVSLLTDLMPRDHRFWSLMLSRVLSIITVSALLYFGFREAIEQTARGEIAMGSVTIAVWPMRWIVPIGFGIWLLQLLVDFSRDIVRYTGERKPA